MISPELPSDAPDADWIAEFVAEGYSEEAAAYLTDVVKGRVDESVLEVD